MKRQPTRANPPVCWLCGRRLYAGGWQYRIVEDEEGRPHPAHQACYADYEERSLP